MSVDKKDSLIEEVGHLWLFMIPTNKYLDLCQSAGEKKSRTACFPDS